ncbi:hypothetical protein [Kineococcus sp. SYSU DK005]|uniref:hypothetical protein n=1 Tax=Kineococcus sp. SYSU DK005 TaxID=3383126 RepID=UPI003D7DB836
MTRTRSPRPRRPVHTVLAGAVAGAAGTTVLNAVTYGDMAVRGRAPSTVPERTATALAERLGRPVGGRGAELEHRTTALGALSGYAAGVGVGKLVGLTRAAGLRMPAGLGGVVTGALAMAASDLPAHALGVTDLRTWTAQDWVSDALPHLAYGLTTHAALRALDPPAAHERATIVDLPSLGGHGGRVGPRGARTPSRASAGLVVRSALLGVAAGGRSTLGLAGPALLSAGTRALPGGAPAAVLSTLALGGELVADKLPSTPSRLSAAGLPARLVSGFAGGAVLARREHARTLLPALAGAAGALAGSHAGAAWRAWAGQRVPDVEAALAEDAVALALTLAATLPHRRG